MTCPVLIGVQLSPEPGGTVRLGCGVVGTGERNCRCEGMAGGRSVGLDLLKSSSIEAVGGSKTGWVEELECGDMDSSQFAQS